MLNFRDQKSSSLAWKGNVVRHQTGCPPVPPLIRAVISLQLLDKQFYQPHHRFQQHHQSRGHGYAGFLQVMYLQLPGGDAGSYICRLPVSPCLRIHSDCHCSERKSQEPISHSGCCYSPVCITTLSVGCFFSPKWRSAPSVC